MTLLLQRLSAADRDAGSRILLQSRCEDRCTLTDHRLRISPAEDVLSLLRKRVNRVAGIVIHMTDPPETLEIPEQAEKIERRQ